MVVQLSSGLESLVSRMLNRLSLLGPVCLRGPDVASIRRASQQRRIALLAVIASSPGGSISRDRLLGLLWPDRDERTARHLLADSLYVLRRTLGDEAIIASADAVRLSPEFVWTDVVEFRRAIAEERWSDALELYRGDFLDGFYVRNAVDFDQWAEAERSRLRALATRAASALANALERAGRIAEAVTAAERALELAPYDEAAFRDLVRLLIASENRARAEAVACGFIERLALDVGDFAVRRDDAARAGRRADRRVRSQSSWSLAESPADSDARTIDSVTASIIAQGRHHWHHERTPHS